MRAQRSRKPVRACYTCLLNLGDHCWLYRSPRSQWSGGRQCRAFQNEAIYEQYRQWLKEPTVKTRKELRQEFFRTRKRTELYHPQGEGSRRR
jgi:hypothetical protein